MIKKLIKAALLGWLAKRFVGGGGRSSGWARKRKGWKALQRHRYDQPMPYSYAQGHGPRGVKGMLVEAFMKRFVR